MSRQQQQQQTQQTRSPSNLHTAIRSNDWERVTELLQAVVAQQQQQQQPQALGRRRRRRLVKNSTPTTTTTKTTTPTTTTTFSRTTPLVNRYDGQSAPIHAITQQGDLALLRLALQAGADVNLATKQDQQTPLHFAAAQEWPEGVQLLLDAGAKVNRKDAYGNIPLHGPSGAEQKLPWAEDSFSYRLYQPRHQRVVDVARTLIEAGSSTKAVNAQGRPAVSTKEMNEEAIIDALAKAHTKRAQHVTERQERKAALQRTRRQRNKHRDRGLKHDRQVRSVVAASA